MSQANNDKHGQCTYCGRDNRGYEDELCSDNCPYELMIAEAPAMLEVLRMLLEDCEAHGLTDNDAHLREARAILARIDKGA